MKTDKEIQKLQPLYKTREVIQRTNLKQKQYYSKHQLGKVTNQRDTKLNRQILKKSSIGFSIHYESRKKLTK